MPPDIAATVDCGDLPTTLGGGETLPCTYSASLPDRTDLINTATATASLPSDPTVTASASGTADVNFDDPEIHRVNYEIHVTDTNGGSWSFHHSDPRPRTRISPATRTRIYDNTPTIEATQQSSTATVTVNCYALEVTKNAQTSLRGRTWRSINGLTRPL